jgi:hypothetical protein
MFIHRNIERIQAVQERRRSNASGKHQDRRTRRNRSRAARKTQAIKDQA